MRKINLILVLIQWFGIFFIISGILRLFYSFYVEELVYLRTVKEEFNSQKTLNILDNFLCYEVYLGIGAYIIEVIIIALINWKRKNHFFNTILVALLMTVFFSTGVFFRGVISNYFNYFGRLFTKDYTHAFIIGGITLTLIGSLLIWKSYRIKKRYSS
jgi:hypothetical protein